MQSGFSGVIMHHQGGMYDGICSRGRSGSSRGSGDS